MSAIVTEAPVQPSEADCAFNLARHCLAQNALHRAGQTALIIGDGAGGGALRMSFAEVLDAVMRLAGGLAQLNLPPRSRIVIRMGNEVDTVLLFFAVIAAGHVAVPTSMMLTTEDVRFVAADAEAAAVALGREAEGEGGFGDALVLRPDDLARLKRAEPLSDFAATAAEEPAYLVYTSGTTGRPKGVLHAHRVALGRRPMHQHWLGLRPGDVMLHAGAFNWTYTLGVGVLDPWSCGATAALARGVSD
ncbi:AMP-binding protein, partial [Hansschlegelia beijingensis]